MIVGDDPNILWLMQQAQNNPQMHKREELTAEQRKEYPLATGLFDYFPDALMAIAHLSFVGNKQHNPGQPLHWDRSKSMDQDDALLRHFKDRGTRDSDGERHRTKVAWRALAALQLEIEQERNYNNPNVQN